MTTPKTSDRWKHLDGSEHSLDGPLGCFPCANLRRSAAAAWKTIRTAAENSVDPDTRVAVVGRADIHIIDSIIASVVAKDEIPEGYRPCPEHGVHSYPSKPCYMCGWKPDLYEAIVEPAAAAAGARSAAYARCRAGTATDVDRIALAVRSATSATMLGPIECQPCKEHPRRKISIRWTWDVPADGDHAAAVALADATIVRPCAVCARRSD